jgi:aspartate aminotransferase-like enzyme
MGSGTLANDVIAAQLSLKPGKGLVLSNGEFGERLIGQAKRFSLSFEAISVDWGEPFNPETIRKAIGQLPDINWLWTVHCETSTGMLNNIAMLKEVCSERGISLCLDCVSSIGAIDVDLRGVHYASGVSGKGLCSFSGLSMVFYEQAPPQSDQILPVYLDLAVYREKDGIPFTVSSNPVYALNKALKNLDINKKSANIAAVSAWLKSKLRKIGLNPVIPDEYASPAIITIALPNQFDSEKVGARVDREGYSISYRSDYLLKRNWVQICLVGNFSQEDLRLLPAILGQILAC